MFCRKCGQELPENAAFCICCGEACCKVEVPEPEVALVEEAPAEEMIAAEVPAEEVPGEEIPVEEVPAEEAPAEEIPVEEIPVEEASVEETPVEEASVEETPAEEIPAEEAVPAEPVAEPIPAPQPAAEPVVEPQPVVKAPVQKAKKCKKRPCFGVRFLMQFLSLIICLVMVVALLAGVLLMDARRLTSSGGLKAVINTVLFSDSGKSARTGHPAAPQAGGVITLSDTLYMEQLPIGSEEDISSLESVDDVIGWLYEELTESMDDVDFSKEQFADFVHNSTVGDFVSEKMAGYAEDVLNGTAKTEITADEIMDLLEENERELKRELGVELSAEDKLQLKQNLRQTIEEEDLNNTIRETVTEGVNEMLSDSGYDLEQIQGVVQAINSPAVLIIMLGVILFLMGLLLLLNFYNLGAGLSWSASAGLFVGLIVSLPLMLMDPLMNILAPDMGEGVAASVAPAVTAAFAPVHYGLLGISFLLLVGSIVIRCISRKRRRMQMLAE